MTAGAIMAGLKAAGWSVAECATDRATPPRWIGSGAGSFVGNPLQQVTC